MPYNGDPAASPRNEVRFLIGDTDPTNELLTDQEIDYLLTQANGIVIRAAYRSVLRLLSKASKSKTKTVGPTTISHGEQVSNWQSLLDTLAAQGGAGGLNTPSMLSAGGIDEPLWSDYDWEARLRG